MAVPRTVTSTTAVTATTTAVVTMTTVAAATPTAVVTTVVAAAAPAAAAAVMMTTVAATGDGRVTAAALVLVLAVTKAPLILADLDQGPAPFPDLDRGVVRDRGLPLGLEKYQQLAAKANMPQPSIKHKQKFLIQFEMAAGKGLLFPRSYSLGS